MNELTDLEKRINERLAESDIGRQLRQNHLQAQMAELEMRLQRYTAVADRLMESVIRPRMERLAACFAGVQAPEVKQSRHSCVYRFLHSPRFPATVTLELGVTRDGDAQNVALQYALQILPVFTPVDGQAHFVMPLDAVDERQAAAWVEERILAFVDAYLRLETLDVYQDENVATDPVCGMRINKVLAAASLEYRGIRYYFCVDECRRKFAEAPERYLASVGGVGG
jgi:YHS domain-containing protein